MSDNKKEKWMTRDVGEQLSAIESYNWTEDQKPAIYVPGGAATWASEDLPKTIPPDSGRHFIDQSRAKVPKYPFEVIFSALEVARPEYRFDEIDTLVNRNSLRKLLDFCHGYTQDSFRIDLYAIRDTLIIERCEKYNVEIIRGSSRSGYGHNFERSFTTFAQGLEGSTSHHRVLEYKLGDLKMAVRFEVDASYDTPADNEAQDDAPTKVEPQGELAQLGDRLQSLQLSTLGKQAHRSKSTSIAVLRSGTGASQSMTAEIKSGKKSVAKIIPQMWFGRTPYLIRGLHSKGTFHKIDITHMDKELMEWENDAQHQLALRKMAALIALLRRIVTDSRNRAAILIFQKRDPERVKVLQRRSKKQPLPDGVIALFWGGE